MAESGMRNIDVFNGDADGICALHQLRLAQPVRSELVTGVKRDIGLLGRVQAAAGDRVTVLDVSLQRNRDALLGLLGRGVLVRYFDHHESGDVPRHPGLEPHIDTAAGVCTSLLVDRLLRGSYRSWAIVGAFGDAMDSSARRLAADLGLDAAQTETLCELGRSINYNAYGESVADLMVPPDMLYRILAPYGDPLAFARNETIVHRLHEERKSDLALALAVRPFAAGDKADAFVLPGAAWSRRVAGTFANHLTAADPARAHAVLAPGTAGGYTVSVRSPQRRPEMAVEACRPFAGGGRPGAAGIDRLEPGSLEQFLTRLGLARS